MREISDLIDKLNLSGRRLSKGHLKIADFIATHYGKAAHMTAGMLAKSAGVSESTVVRFAMALGYEGYPQLQKALQEVVRHRLTAVQRLELSSDMAQAQVLETVLKGDIQNIRSTIEEMNMEAFENAVQRILSAKTIYVMGLRSAAPLAQFFGYYLNYLFDNVRLVSSGVTDVFEEIVRISKDDVLIGISFPRYSTRTLEAMRFATKAGAQVIAITDGVLSPLKTAADVCLQAQTEMASFVDSLAAPLSVINALIVAMAMHRKDELGNHFKQLEGIWDAHSVYLPGDEQ